MIFIGSYLKCLAVDNGDQGVTTPLPSSSDHVKGTVREHEIWRYSCAYRSYYLDIGGTLHQHPVIWGPDSDKYNPGRFANGVSAACKFPHVYMPFGVGPSICLGQNVAMAELKIILALILFNFKFSLTEIYAFSNNEISYRV